jgi:hypothetical protein
VAIKGDILDTVHAKTSGGEARLWYDRAEDAIGYAKFYSRSHAMIVRVFDESGALIETHESEGAFREF